MTATLIIAQAEKLEEQIIKTIMSCNTKGVYISLNKTQRSIETMLRKNEVDAQNLFFIDCCTSEKQEKDVIHIQPDDIAFLNKAIHFFMRDLREEAYILIDGLSTLLLYNSENTVVKFVKELTEYISERNIELIAVSVVTKEEELLKKIFNFFDEVRKQ